MGIKKNQIELSKIKYLMLLGKGGYGTVYLVKYDSDQMDEKLCAMKLLDKARLSACQADLSTNMEINIMKNHNSSFITRLFGSAEDQTYIYILMEFVPCGDMFRFLHIVKKMPECHVKYIIVQLAFALSELHQRHIIIRDLKLEHILLDSSGYIKLVDFGLATSFASNAKSMCGSLGYVAPEQLNSQQQRPCLDCWALGIIFCQLITGRNPVIGETQLETFSNILNKEFQFDDELFSPQAVDFAKKCLQRNPEKRIQSTEILNHPLFIDIPFQQLKSKQLVLPYFTQEIHDQLKTDIPEQSILEEFNQIMHQSHQDLRSISTHDINLDEHICTSIIYEKSQSDLQSFHDKNAFTLRASRRLHRVLSEDDML